MASTVLESSMIKKIKRDVKSIPHTRIKKLWSSAANRDIDLLVVTHGLACFYEIKVKGEQPTPWQRGRLKFWQGSCADVGWFDDVDKCVMRIRHMASVGKIAQGHIAVYYMRDII